MIYFTSDQHFGHTNILRFCNRPWETVEEMGIELVHNINSTLNANDELYVLGDFSFRINMDEAIEWLEMINCKNRSLIRGNHDKDWANIKGGSCWKEVCDYKELKTEDGHKICLMHYPLLAWNGSSHDHSYNLHGHQHHQGSHYNLTNAINGVRRYDVGVDANNFTPVSLDEILGIFSV